jgi:CHAT domain
MPVQVLFLSSNAGVRPGLGTLSSRDLGVKAPEAEGLNWLDVDREYTSLQLTLGFPGLRGNNVLQTLPDVRWLDIARVLSHVTDRIVLHFSGHGDASGHLYLRGGDGAPLPVGGEHLTTVISRFRERIPLVVLNACYTAQLADALASSIDVVVGMTRAVDDRAAICFSERFYQTLIFEGGSIQDAFNVAKASVQGEFRDERNEPCLRCRDGVDPSQIVLFSSLRDDTRLASHHWARILDDQTRLVSEELESLDDELKTTTTALRTGTKANREWQLRVAELRISAVRKGLEGRITGLSLAQFAIPPDTPVQDLQTFDRFIRKSVDKVNLAMAELQRRRGRQLEEQLISLSRV